MSKKVLITGVAGFLGMHAALSCLKLGYQVVGVDDLNDFTYGAYLKFDRLSVLGIDAIELARSSYVKKGNFEFHCFDISDIPTVGSMIQDGKFDLILHFASLSSVKAATLSPSVFFNANVKGLEAILEGIRALKNERPLLINTSSASVYGDSDTLLLTEDDKNLLKPRSIYATTKLMGEQLCEVYARLYKIKTVSLRIFNVYGPFMRPDTLIFKLQRLMTTHDSLDLYDEGKLTHDFLYIDDFIACLQKVMDFDGDKLCEVFNIGSGEAISVRDLISKCEKFNNTKIEVYPCQRPLGEDGNLTSCNEKFIRYFDLLPKISLDDGLALFHKWSMAYLHSSDSFFKNL